MPIRATAAATSPVAAAPTFFGAYTMLREFWAEDPDWTNPGDGVALTSWRDAGTAAINATAASVNGGAVPRYVASGINGKPSISFDATSETVGGVLTSGDPTVSGAYTLIVVGRFRTTPTVAEYLVDNGNTGARNIMGATATKWRAGSINLLIDAGTPDTSQHVFTLYLAANDAELWVDGVSIGTNTVGAFANTRGLNFGANGSANNQCADGLLAYVAMAAGDLTADAGYAAWLNGIQSYYGI